MLGTNAARAGGGAAEARVPRPIQRRTFVPHEHDVARERLFADYFAENPRWGPNVFHRRFRMSRDLFLRIVHTLEGRDEYFQYREDGIARPGLTPLQKCTVAIRQLAYGTTTDMFDEYLHVGEKTGREFLKTFCKLVVEAFGDTYLRRPTADDGQSLMRMHETVDGFPRMLGSIDCPAHFWYKEVIADVLYACIIMHNMIVEQEHGHVTDWVDDEAGSSSSKATSHVT
ncbi:uncharacterized protein LOC125193576 [Salvia hispanica]|uniref:uncharacterized protein LOC125193576 n=1 Tax=Salvia hispanica TaxID=49212 RepID=UPI0020090159|nr:uncharacterized protein LOC125193576 [Salvia hispanica]